MGENNEPYFLYLSNAFYIVMVYSSERSLVHRSRNSLRHNVRIVKKNSPITFLSISRQKNLISQFTLFHVHYLINEAYYSICPYTQCMYVPFGHAICMPRISSGELYIIPRTYTNWSWSCSSSAELFAIEQMYVPEIVAPHPALFQ